MFDFWDYVCFSSVFVLSVVIGIFYAYKDRNVTHSESFHLGDRKMPVIPVSLSLTVTFMSSLSIIGTPAEVYTNGTMIIWMIAAFALSTAGAAYIFIPVFFRLRLTSCFEYLELRFDKTVRRAASIVYVIQTLLYLGIVSYVPALALEVVTGISLMTSIVITVLICTLYTTLGGMKSVLWTDSVQFVIIIFGLLIAVNRGAHDVSGATNVWNIANNGGRIILADISGDPVKRHTVWNIVIGGSVRWLYLYGINQAEVQRACSTSSLRKARVALGLNILGLALLWILIVAVGLVMFAYYSTCDPVKYGIISSRNQLIPRFIMDVLGNSFGLSGIFVACIFSGTLSTVSSGLNAMSAVILEDFIKAFFPNCCAICKKEVALCKTLVLIAGCCVLFAAIITSYIGGLILEVGITVLAVTAGPLLGLYLSGMVLPWTNRAGAISGLLSSIAVVGWIVIGSKVNHIQAMFPLPVSTQGCSSTDNFTNLTTALGVTSTLVPPGISTKAAMSTRPVTVSSSSTESGLFLMVDHTTISPGLNSSTMFADKHSSLTANSTIVTKSLQESTEESTSTDALRWIYSISYMWYAFIGTAIHLLIATLVSFLTGPNHIGNIDQRLLSDIITRGRAFTPQDELQTFQLTKGKDTHELMYTDGLKGRVSEADQLLDVETQNVRV